MKAVKAATRTFGKEIRNTSWLKNLDKKSDLMRKNVTVDFTIVKYRNDEIGNILVNVPQNKKDIVLREWNKSYHKETEVAKQLYFDKYKPSLITFASSSFMTLYLTVLLGPDHGSSSLPYIFSTSLMIAYGSQHMYRTFKLYDAYKKAVASDFVLKMIESNDKPSSYKH